jgi:8-oxo-dGTP diphosphatase
MVEVSAGIINSHDRFLCLQKGPSKYHYLSNKWEFPGGKVEKGENPRDTIARELFEELNMDIEGKDVQFLCVTEHQYPDFHVVIHSFLISYDDPQFELTEHLSSKWCSLDNIGNLDWAEADRRIIVELERWFNGRR